MFTLAVTKQKKEKKTVESNILQQNYRKPKKNKLPQFSWIQFNQGSAVIVFSIEFVAKEMTYFYETVFIQINENFWVLKLFIY